MAKSLDWQTEVARHQVCSSIINNFIMMMYENRNKGGGDERRGRLPLLVAFHFQLDIFQCLSALFKLHLP